MLKLALVDHEGRVLMDTKPTTPSQVETSEEPLWLIAAREAARQSTNIKETK